MNGPLLASFLAAHPHVDLDVARGHLVRVLEEFSTPFAGFYLFYPARRQASRRFAR